MTPGTLLLIEPESSGYDLIPAALSLDLDVHVLSSRPFTCTVGGRPVGHTRVDGSASSFVRAALEFAGKHEVVGVAPGFEYAVPAAAVAAALLDLPGAGAGSGLGDRLQDKELMHGVLTRAGVPVAGGISFDLDEATPAGLPGLAAQVGFPSVVKPVDGSGSLWVRRVDDVEGLQHVMREYAAHGPVRDLGRPVGKRLRLEPYLHGPEVSVEGYVTPRETHIVAVTRKQLGPEPHFVEIGHTVEALLPKAERGALEEVTRAAVRALGLETAVFHLEARLTARGPVVIEVGARLGGDRIHKLVSLATGFSLPDATVRLLTGLPVPPPPPATRAAGVRLFTVPTPARIPDPAKLHERLWQLPGCVEAVVTCTADTQLVPATDFRQRFGHAVLTAPDHAALEAALAHVDDLIAEAVEEALSCAS